MKDKEKTLKEGMEELKYFTFRRKRRRIAAEIIRSQKAMQWEEWSEWSDGRTNPSSWLSLTNKISFKGQGESLKKSRKSKI